MFNCQAIYQNKAHTKTKKKNLISPNYLPHRNENMCPHKHLYSKTHSRYVSSSQKVEKADMVISDKLNTSRQEALPDITEFFIMVK